MKLGLVSAIYDDVDYEKLIDLVADAGLECVEVACWPVEKAERRYAGVSHINVEKVLMKHIVVISWIMQRRKKSKLLLWLITRILWMEILRKETVQYHI